MTDNNKIHLAKMIDSIIGGDVNSAKGHFSDYADAKSSEIIQDITPQFDPAASGDSSPETEGPPNID